MRDGMIAWRGFTNFLILERKFVKGPKELMFCMQKKTEILASHLQLNFYIFSKFKILIFK